LIKSFFIINLGYSFFKMQFLPSIMVNLMVWIRRAVESSLWWVF
jgi:hypothetical protein